MYAPGDITLILNGANTATSTVSTNVSAQSSHGLKCAGLLTVQGGGSLTAIGGEVYGNALQANAAYGSFGVNANEIHMQSGSLTGGGGNTNGAINNTAYSYGVYSTTGITASGGTLTGTGGKVEALHNSSYGVSTIQNIRVNGGTLAGTGGPTTGYNSGSFGVTSGEAITISDGSMTAVGGTTEGEAADSLGASCSSATIFSGSLTATGGTTQGDRADSLGVFSPTTVTISDGVLTAEGGTTTGQEADSLGVACTTAIISGGRVSAVGGSVSSLTPPYTDAPRSVGFQISSLTLSGGMTEAKGHTRALSQAATLVGLPARASADYYGASPVAYVPGDNDTYHWFQSKAASSAAISDVTVSGTTGSHIAPAEAAVTLADDWFKSDLAANTDVSAWFRNLPAGLAATLKTAVAAGDTTATVTFSGMPTAVSTAAMSMIIPAASLVGNEAVTVTANPNAKWAIVVPTITVTPSGSINFPQGQAAGSAVFTVASSDGSLNATRHYGSATLDGQALDLGGVGAPGTDGSVADGSLIATVHQAKLNTLAVGNHTLAIALGGGFEGVTVTGVITVTPAKGGGGDGESAVPKTGDGTPLNGLALLALLAFGGLAAMLWRKRPVKR